MSSNVVGGLDIIRQWRFSAVLEHQAAKVRMHLNPAWKVEYIDPEDVQSALHKHEDTRRIGGAGGGKAKTSLSESSSSSSSSSSSAAAAAAGGSGSNENEGGGAGAEDNNSNNNNHKKDSNDDGDGEEEEKRIPRTHLIPFLSLSDETMAPRQGTSDVLSGFSVGYGANHKSIKFYYASLPPALSTPDASVARNLTADVMEKFERKRLKAWCKRCVQFVLEEDNRVISIDGSKKLHKLRTKSMLSSEQRITLGGTEHTAFKFNIAYEQKSEASPQSHGIALATCDNDRGYLVLVECISQNELENYVPNTLMKNWLSDGLRFELGAIIDSYCECSHPALQVQQALFGELHFTDNDAAISFRLPMHPFQLRPDHSPTVPPANGSLCAVTLDITMHQGLLDSLEEDEAVSSGGKERLVNVVLFIEVEDLLKDPNFPAVFSGDEYSQRRHERFAEDFKDSRLIGQPLSVPIGKRTGRSTTCAFSTMMGEVQSLVKSMTVTTLVGSHGAAATYFTRMRQGMFDEYLYLYQHLLNTLTFFSERDISGTFSRYRSVPIRIQDADLNACYPLGSLHPTAREEIISRHRVALKNSADGEVDSTMMSDIIQVEDLIREKEQQQKAAEAAEKEAERLNKRREKIQKIKKEKQQQRKKNKQQQQQDDLEGDEEDEDEEEEEEYLDEEEEDEEGQSARSLRLKKKIQQEELDSAELDSVISTREIPRIKQLARQMIDEEDEKELVIGGGLSASSGKLQNTGDSNLLNTAAGAAGGSSSIGGGSSSSPVGSKKPPGSKREGDYDDDEEEQEEEDYDDGDQTPTSVSGLQQRRQLQKERQKEKQRRKEERQRQKQQQESLGSVASAVGAGEDNESYTPSAATGTAAAGGGGGEQNQQYYQQTGQEGEAAFAVGGGGGDGDTSNVGATAGDSQQQQQQPTRPSHAVPTLVKDEEPIHQPGQPTAQQLADLTEALKALNDDNDPLLQGGEEAREGAKKTKGGESGDDEGDDENEVGNVEDAQGTAGAQKAAAEKSKQSSLQNSYIELCKEEGCRPNSYLLQKLPIIPRITQTIEQLDMSHNYVGHQGFVAILRLLDLLPKVSAVYFNSMSLDNSDVTALCEELIPNRTITSIFLRNNPRITLPAAKSLLKLLRSNSLITTISLTGTGIGLQLQQKIEQEAETNKEKMQKANQSLHQHQHHQHQQQQHHHHHHHHLDHEHDHEENENNSQSPSPAAVNATSAASAAAGGGDQHELSVKSSSSPRIIMNEQQTEEGSRNSPLSVTQETSSPAPLEKVDTVSGEAGASSQRKPDAEVQEL